MRRVWPLALVGVIVLVSFGSVLIGAFVNTEKSFSLPRVDLEATLNRDGSMDVVEHITYDFSGSFSYGTRPIPVGAYQISDVRVEERGRELSTVGAPYNLQWFFSAEDGQRTFDIAYRVDGVTQVGPDVGELYWKWVGESHPEIGRVTATLRLPPGSEGVRAWGHGELTGRVDVDGDTVRWSAPDVPEGSFVEGRVAVPAGVFTVPPSGLPRLATILGEEDALAEAANRARAEAREDAAQERETRDVLNVAVPIITLLGVFEFLYLWLRYGREPQVAGIGEYYRDLPDDPPAVVDALLHWGRVRPVAFSATIVDLAQRGYLTIDESRTKRSLLPDSVEFAFRRADNGSGALTAYEQSVLDRLFHEGDEVSQRELTAWARHDQSTAQRFWQQFGKDVRADFDRRRYQHGERGRIFAFNVLAAIVVALAGAGALAYRAWVAGAIAIAWAVVQVLLTALLRRRTAAGAQRAAEWEGVANFLRDFSELEDAPAGHVVLWERYLVYAVALGVSAELVRGLAMRVPEATQTGYAATWYHSSNGAGFASFTGLDTLGRDVGSSFVSAATPQSSGSGGGGGFSGGGGGGGGGGGIGAG